MKKLFLVLICFAFAVSTSAQEKSIFGVRAGLNVASMDFSASGVTLSPDSKVSFQLGAAYQYNFLSSLPFYVETGLYFTGRGCKIDNEGETLKANLYYLQVPVLVSYHFDVADAVSIQPYAGVYYGLGVSGKFKQGDYKTSAFKDDQDIPQALKRSDFGLRFGVGVGFLKRYYAGLGYDLGLMNISKSGGEFDGLKTKNGCFYIQVGYNF